MKWAQPGMHVATESYTTVAGESRFAVLTPYLVPSSLQGRKVVNLGDGFILRAIERLVGRFSPDKTFSPRVPLTIGQQAILEATPAVMLAGANQLHDGYTVWPGLTAEKIRTSDLRLVPFGIGLHGEAGYTDQLSDATREVLVALHERIEYSSWRCPHTVAYLRQELPQLSTQMLMTGCPVIYDRPLLSGAPFIRHARRIAVSVTERSDFWERERTTIDFVARHFPRSERYLVLHQNYSPPTRFEYLRHRWLPQTPEKLNVYQRLRQYAVRRGYRVVCPADADACIDFYDTIDMHVGSRLHAHLLCLSRARRSWLIPVDGRATGIAEFLGFPLCQPENIEPAIDFNFEVVRARAVSAYDTMRFFLDHLPE